MTLPKFVNIKQRNDWFPEHDSLLVDGVLSEDNNAFLFWQFNCKVRKALQEIRVRIEDGEELKVTRTLVAQMAKIQYAGLYNKKRRGWVMLEIRMLIKLRERVHKKKVVDANTHESEVKELKSLIRDLHQDKVNLGIERSILNRELDKYKQLVKTQDKQLARLKKLIEDKLSD